MRCCQVVSRRPQNVINVSTETYGPCLLRSAPTKLLLFICCQLYLNIGQTEKRTHSWGNHWTVSDRPGQNWRICRCKHVFTAQTKTCYLISAALCATVFPLLLPKWEQEPRESPDRTEMLLVFFGEVDGIYVSNRVTTC